MTTGEINNYRAHITLFVRGAGGQGDIEFTVDTGFTATMTLPPAVCIALKLPLIRTHPTFLADGSQIRLDVYLLTVIFNEVEREAETFAIESDPLIGMKFLDGHEICLKVTENGTVRIEPL